MLPLFVFSDRIQDVLIYAFPLGIGCGLNYCFFSFWHADPDVLKRQIQVWTTKQLPGWERIYRALTEDYDPLHNYDRHEEWTEAGEASAQGTNTNSVAGFNQSAGLADRDRSDQDTSSKSNTSRQGHLYGNIGVTTSATMLTEELQVRAAHNMLDVILENFKQEFVILIY